MFPPMIFNRVAEPLAPKLLQACAGTFKLEGGQEILLILSPENALSIQLPGQPPLALETVIQTTFQTTTYPRITVSFQTDVNGQVKSLEVLHPSGLFMAMRNG